MNIISTIFYAVSILFLILSLFIQQVVIDLGTPLETYVAKVKYTLMSVFIYVILSNEGDIKYLKHQEGTGKLIFMKRAVNVLCGMHVLAIGADAYISKYYYGLTFVVLIVLLYYVLT